MAELFLLTPENYYFLHGIADGKKGYPKLNPKAVGQSYHQKPLWILFIAMGACGLLVPILLGYALWQQTWQDHQFDQRGITVQALVIDCILDDQSSPRLEYQYEVAATVYKDADYGISGQSCEIYPDGRSLEIQYLSNEPTQSRITDEIAQVQQSGSDELLMYGSVGCTFVLFFAMFCLAAYFIIANLKAWRLYHKLAAEGVICDGNLTQVDVEVSKQRYSNTVRLKVRYAFIAPDGRTLTGQQMTHGSLMILQPPPVGTPIKVLYVNDRTFVAL